LLLSNPEQLQEGVNRTKPAANDLYSLIVRMPQQDAHQAMVLVLSSFRTEDPITLERRKQAESVLSAYVAGYRHAWRNQRSARLARLHSNLLGTMPEILQLISSVAERTQQALKRAGDLLVSNGYRRVMFSMVDESKRVIRGEVECHGSETDCDTATMSCHTLDVLEDSDGLPNYNDIQQKAVIDGVTIVVADALSHPLTLKSIVEATGQRGAIVIPMKQRDEVIGTMFVERDDRQPLERDEIQALEFFVAQLSRAISVTNWVDTLDAANESRPEAVLVIDHSDRIVYANRAATRRFGLESEGHGDELLVATADRIPVECIEAAREARRTPGTVSKHFRSNDPEDILQVVSASPVKDWRGATIGSLIEIQDLRQLTHLLRALRSFSACGTREKLAQEVLTSLQSFGHSWARLYLLDTDRGRLAGFDQFGLPEDSDGSRAFHSKTLFLNSRTTAEGSTWLCFDKRRSLVLSTCRQYGVGHTYTTPTGLTVLNVAENHCPAPLKKHDGDIWIDLPLFAREDADQPIGKVSVHCPDDLTPEGLKHLQILAEAAGAVFTIINAREEQNANEVLLRREAAFDAIAMTCHQLQSGLATLPVLTKLYELAKNGAAVKALDQRWSRLLAQIQQELDDAQLHLQPLQPNRRRCGLNEFLRTVLADLAPGAVRFTTTTSEFEAEFDQRLFREAFAELVMNARKAVGERLLTLTISAESLRRHGVPWCWIELRDNGLGIPPERLPRVFEDFFSEWPERKTQGTGLSSSRAAGIRGKTSDSEDRVRR
jgi:PAS domain-containing protein